VETNIIITRLMDLHHHSTRILLASKDGLRSNEYKMLQLEIRQLQNQLNDAQRKTKINTDTN
jgi:hypothetical protein